jgi:DnaJ domain
VVRVKRDHVIEFPAGAVPCPGCGSLDKALVFRGWSRVSGFLWSVSELRMCCYACRDCTAWQTTGELWRNALLGWWSFPNWFFFGWRSLLINWQSLWGPPLFLDRWEALTAGQFIAGIRAERQRGAAVSPDVDLDDSPLRFLSRTDMERVLGADGLYELFAVSPGVDVAELRAAFRRRCKEVHPDLQTSQASNERMIELNNAWAILRDERLREAYDWLQTQRAGATG